MPLSYPQNIDTKIAQACYMLNEVFYLITLKRYALSAYIFMSCFLVHWIFSEKLHWTLNFHWIILYELHNILSRILLEKEMATHSSVLAWRIPGTVDPDGLPSMGSHRVGHDWSDLATGYCFDSRILIHLLWNSFFLKYLTFHCLNYIPSDLYCNYDITQLIFLNIQTFHSEHKAYINKNIMALIVKS